MSAEQSGGRLDPAHGVLALQFQLQYADLEDFVRGYAVNLSPAGMFIAAHAPPAVGTALRFEVVLADERPILRGEGQVVWTADPARDPAEAPALGDLGDLGVLAAAPSPGPLSGLGVRFGRLDAKSRAVLDRVLAYKAAHPDLFFTRAADPYTAGPPDAGPGYRLGTPPGSVPTAAGLPVAPPLAAPAAPPRLALPPEPLRFRGAPGAAASPQLAAEEAALQALLQPVSLPPLPTAPDAARLLDALLDRRT